MLKRKIPVWLALPAIFMVAATFYRLDTSAADASATRKPKVWSNEDCLACHANKRVLLNMQSKRGDPTYCQAAFDAIMAKGGAKTDSSYAPVKK